MEIKTGIEIEEFWALFPEGTKERVGDLEAGGKKGVPMVRLDDVGRVEVWLDECSEGADRGGYVRYFELLDVTCGGTPVILEDAGDEVLFEGRSSIL